MKKVEFSVSKQNNVDTIKYVLNANDVYDDRAVEKVSALNNIIAIQYTEEDGNRVLTSYAHEDMTLASFIRKTLDKKQVLCLMSGLAALFEIGTQGVPVSYIYKDENYIYVNETTLAVKGIILPIKQEIMPLSEIPCFLRKIISQMMFNESDKDDYVARIITSINTPDFTLAKFKTLVNDELEKMGLFISKDNGLSDIMGKSGVSGNTNNIRVNKVGVMNNIQNSMNNQPPMGQPMQPGQPPMGRPMQPGQPPMGQPMQPGQPPMGRPMQPGQPPVGQPMQPGQPPMGRPMQPGQPPMGRPMQPGQPPMGQPMQPGQPPMGRPMQPGQPPMGQPMQPGQPPMGRPMQPGQPPMGQPMQPGQPPMGRPMQPGQPPMGRPMQPGQPPMGQPMQPGQPPMGQPMQPGQPPMGQPMQPGQPPMGQPMQPGQPPVGQPMQPGQPPMGRPMQPGQPVQPEEKKEEPVVEEIKNDNASEEVLNKENEKPEIPKEEDGVSADLENNNNFVNKAESQVVEKKDEPAQPVQPPMGQPVQPVQPPMGQPMQPGQPPMGQPVQPVQPPMGQPMQPIQPPMGQPMQPGGMMHGNLVGQMGSKPVPHIIRKKTGEIIYITKPEFAIGKSKTKADYALEDNTAISRVHCIIVQRDGVNYIKDNGSTNHTFVNGVELEPSKEILLKHKTVIQMGDEEFTFLLRNGE